jgi:hypothetical protein
MKVRIKGIILNFWKSVMETEEAPHLEILFANIISVRCLARMHKETFRAQEDMLRREIRQQWESVERITSIIMLRGLLRILYTQLRMRLQESMPIQPFKVAVNRAPLALKGHLDKLRLNEKDFSFYFSVTRKKKSSRNLSASNLRDNRSKSKK